MRAAVNKAYIHNNVETMTVGQVPFTYTESELATLVEFISPERLQMYIASVRYSSGPVDRLRKGIRLYERNTALSEVLYTVVQGFEVTFRNAVHNRLSADHGAEWFDNLELLPSERDAVADVRRTIQNKPETVTAGRMVGELSFGFWVRLFSAEYASTLWGPSLSHVIHPTTNDRRAVYSRLQDLKTLRNRIAHHNRIIGRTLSVQQYYEQSLETINWFSPTMRAWVAATNTVEQRLVRKTIAAPQTKPPSLPPT